jgi:AGZA family xanthine/uracil permease-like MFS transporter
MLAERLFKLREHRTSIRVEVLGGATTFITMAYIMVVNPAILSFAGSPRVRARWPPSWRPPSAPF